MSGSQAGEVVTIYGAEINAETGEMLARSFQIAGRTPDLFGATARVASMTAEGNMTIEARSTVSFEHAIEVAKSYAIGLRAGRA